jgi:hypothetical protein
MPTAHVKYYGQEQKHDQKSHDRVKKVALKTFSGIEKSQRNIYPDTASKLIKLVSPFGCILDRVMYKTYRKEFKK